MTVSAYRVPTVIDPFVLEVFVLEYSVGILRCW